MTADHITDEQRAEHAALVAQSMATHEEYRALVGEAGDWLVWGLLNPASAEIARSKADELASSALAKRAEWLDIHEQGKASAYGTYLRAEAERRKAEGVSR